MIDLTKVLETLASKRPIFHSEADFQHALAWEIHLLQQECEVRLEFKPPDADSRLYLDIWIASKDTTLAVELKYKTRKLHHSFRGETFALLDQSAQDVTRYDFVNDIRRLERIVYNHNGISGSAIFLTNDSSYWRPPRNDRTIDAKFRIHQSRTLAKELRWRPSASAGTTKGRREAILIKGDYKLEWRDYSTLSEESHGKFRYLLVKVGSKC